MQQEIINEIDGIWTSDDIKQITSWVSGEDGSRLIKESQNLAEVQSKVIKEMSFVDMEKLKVPFTFNL